jgi:tetratricopeptide (TPR) repeat protein
LVLTAITTYKTADKMDEMVEQMETVVKSNPNNLKLLFILARNYSKYGKQFAKNGYIATSEKYYSQAINYYEQALALNPESTEMQYSINYNLGVLYYNRGAHEYKKGDKADMGKLQEYFSKAKPILGKANGLKANPNIDKMISTINDTFGE